MFERQRAKLCVVILFIVGSLICTDHPFLLGHILANNEHDARSVFSPGDLDTSFGGGDGIVTHPVGAAADNANSVKIRADGKIVVGGTVNLGGGSQDFVVTRYNSDGSLDTTFDGDGIVTVSVAAYDNKGYIQLQPDDKIVIAGYSIVPPGSANNAMEVVRLNSNGSLDTTFDGDGKVSIVCGCTIDSVAIQPNGKILLGGNAVFDGFQADSVVYRLNSDGSPDLSFDTDGRSIVNINHLDAFQGDERSTVSLGVQSHGKIVAAGYTTFARSANSFDDDYTAFRLNPDGSLDTSFDNDGKVVTQVAIGDRALDLAIQPDGKIVLVGFTIPTFDCGIVRYNPDGSLDTSFDGDGKLIASIGTDDFMSAVEIQTDGKLVVGGSSSGFALARFNSDGSFDTTFSGDGRVITNSLGGAADVAIQSDGRILLAGTVQLNGAADFAIARYMGDASAPVDSPFDFDGDGKTDVSIFRPNGAIGAEWWWSRSSDGGNGAVTFGAATDMIVAGDYTGDGKADIAVWRPSNGNWFVLRSEDSSFFAFPFGTSGDVPVPADFDGDGKTDAGVFRPTDGTWYISRSSGGTTIAAFGLAGDRAVPADYDGDGKADIAIFRPNGASGAEWWLQRSTNSTVFAAQFGASTDNTVVGDHTGDGKADIAIWRPSNGDWYVLRSEDQSFYAFPFGTNGDYPAPGDYDGDGKTDAAVFRPSNSTWYAQRSTAGTLIQQFGASGDLPVPNAYVR